MARYTFHSTPIHIHHVLAHQDAIGWTNLLEGCIDKGWTETQSAYYRMISSRRSSFQWTVAIITKLWDVAWDLWEQRNGFLHARENQALLHGMAGIDAEIRFQFQQGVTHLPRRVHYLFEGSVEDLLSTSIRHWKKWLDSVIAAWAMSADRQAQRDQEMAASRQLMQAWLATA